LLFKTKADFKTVFNEYYNPLCNYANNIIINVTYAEDVVQEVFIKLWSMNNSLVINESIKSYLFKMTKNRALEFLRSQKSRSQLHEKANITEVENSNIDELSEVYMRMEQINKSLRHLPPKCKEVFALHKFNGLTYSEIASTMDISVKTVENHMSKALKILRSILGEKSTQS